MMNKCRPFAIGQIIYSFVKRKMSDQKLHVGFSTFVGEW